LHKLYAIATRRRPAAFIPIKFIKTIAMTNRRIFIKQSALLFAGLSADPASLLKKKKKIGLQLYTMRAALAKDPKTTIEKIGSIGYTDVETFGYTGGKYFGYEPKAFSQLLKDNKLISTSGHYGLNNYLYQNASDDEVKKLIDAVKTLGQEYLTIPSVQRSATAADDYKPLAEKMNKAARLCKDAGITLGYHNHDFEFKDLPGGKGYDVLLKETDPSLVKFELDLYWAVKGGQDPITMFKQHPGRFPLWHVKDMDKVANTKNTEVGLGSIDFKKIFSNAKLSGMKHFYVEMDTFQIDPFESITKSYQFINKNII
jgi:sugar phosphate isomerase/epimerase